MASAAGSGGGNLKVIDELSFAIMLGERLRSEVDEAVSFKQDCASILKLTEKLLERLRCMVRQQSSTNQPFYERPNRRILAETRKNLERAVDLVRRCRRQSFFSRMVSIIGAADFQKVSNLLEASTGDLDWLLSIFDDLNDDDGNYIGGGALPPIASNDPILSWVWPAIAQIMMGPQHKKVAAANYLASFAKDNDHNKRVIVDELGVPPLLKMLKEASSPEAQIASATALYNLCNEKSRVAVLVEEGAIPLVVKVLWDSPMRVQSQIAILVSRMAEKDPTAREDFGKENVIRPLVTLLSFETFSDDDNWTTNGSLSHSDTQYHRLPSIVNIKREVESSTRSHASSGDGRQTQRSLTLSYSGIQLDASNRLWRDRKDRENEKPEMKLELKVSCSKALWMLTRGSILNSRRVSETKGLLCLAKLVEKNDGELGYNCLYTLKEIAAAAELSADLRRSAFKTSSPAAKAVVNQLFRVINNSECTQSLVAACKAIGSLARIFPARDTRVITPLVSLLSNKNLDVATEAAIALGKFVSPENYLNDAHSKTIIENNGIQPVMRLLRENDRAQWHGLYLLCYLTLRADNQTLEQSRVFTALEGVDKALLAQHPDLRELVSKAVYHINLYHHGSHSQRFSFVP